MREALSGIDVQLKRRHDLVPAVVEAAKGYMQYEQKVLENTTMIRSQLASGKSVLERQGLENSLSQALKTIFAVAEAYPDLKASHTIMELQKSLVEIEDQIQMARRYYNGTVRNYNIAVESFPGNIIAAAFHFSAADYFEIELATERQAPSVKLSE